MIKALHLVHMVLWLQRLERVLIRTGRPAYQAIPGQIVKCSFVTTGILDPGSPLLRPRKRLPSTHQIINASDDDAEACSYPYNKACDDPRLR
jgi:hypothetical protein